MNVKLSPAAVAGGVALVGFLVISLLFGFTIVSVEEDEAANVEFDPALYVDGVWENIQTTIKDSPADLAAILGRIEPGPDGTTPKEDLVPVAEEYGLITPGDAHAYMVITTGVVTDVDTETSRGTIGLDVDGYDGPIEVRAYIGRRIPSDETSVRDATGIIEFGDFADQVEYGKVATEINQRVVEGLEDIDVEALEGEEIQLTGTLMMRTQNLTDIPTAELIMVPIEILVS